MGLIMNKTALPLVAAFLSSSFFSLPATQALAQDSDGTKEIDNIIVTANRREQPLLDVGNSVTVITDVDIEKGQFVFVLDALATVPGVAISQNGAFGGTASVSIRGSGGNNTLIFVDGVRMNDPSSPGSAFNFGNLDPYNIERIEVLRGPQSVLYGSDAIGGVVNVISKTGGDGSGASGFFEAGSFETFRAGGTMFGGTRELGYNLSLSGTHSGGISAADEADGNTEEDGFDGYTLSGKLSSNPTDLITGTLIGRYSDSRSDFDSFGPADGDQESELEEFLVAARGSATTPGGNLTNTVSLEFSSIDRKNLTNGVESFTSEGERSTVDYLAVYEFLEAWTLTAGAQHESAEAATVDPQSISTDSVLGELAFSGLDGLVVTAGMRYVDHETFGDATTGRVTASYSIPDTGTRFIANWAEGFKSPSVFQLTYICTFCGLTEPTADLQPETSEGFEIGVEQSLFADRVRVGGTWFHLESENAIVFTFTDGYQNLGRARSEGYELTLDASLSEDINFKANFTQTDAVDLDSGAQVIRQPEQMAYAVVDWQVTDKTSASISATYNGEELNFGGGSVDSWTRVDVRVARNITDSLQVYGRIDNLFDEEYQHVAGYGTPGLSGFVGVRANW